jgi:hypothetical protein
VLSQRGALELSYIDEVRDKLADRVALIPWQAKNLVGSGALTEVAEATVSLRR